MIVNTTRFGQVEIDDDRVLEFPKGLLGFARHQRYALIQPTGESYFFWLQAIDAPELAFVVTDPSVQAPTSISFSNGRLSVSVLTR